MKKNIAILIGLIAVVLVIFSFIPCWRVSGRSYTCWLCGAHKTKKTTRFLGLPIWISRSAARRDFVTDIYDEYIGQQHEHEWSGGAAWYTAGTLRGRVLHGDGFHTVQPFPFWQPRLTRTALMAVEQVKDWPKEKKMKLFYTILHCTSREDYEDVAEIYKKTEQGQPEELWSNWLEKKKRSEQATAPDD